MPETLIQRGPFTKWVVNYLTVGLADPPAVPVGYASIPAGAGWIGSPNAPTSKFVSYVTVNPLSASAAAAQGPMTNAQADWILPYSIGGYSLSADGAEAVMDRARVVLQGLLKQTHLLGADTYKVARVHLESLGGLNRVDAVDPPFWGQIDTVSFWLMKEN